MCVCVCVYVCMYDIYMIPTHTYIYIVFILKGMCLQIVFLYIRG